MNLHLLWDEKITHRIIKIFEEVFPEENFFLFWSNNSIESYHFAYDDKYCQILKDNNTLHFDVTKVDKVIIHGLDIKKIEFCNKHLDKDVPVFWILWGTELYNGLLSKKGYELFYVKAKKKSFKEGLVNFLRKHGVVFSREKKILSFFNSNNVTMVCAEQEYNLLRKYYPRQTKYLKNKTDFFYYPIDEILGKDLKEKEAHGNIMMIGNSASLTNNHLYVFGLLNKLSLRNRKIVTPLSYGGNPSYKEEVMAVGRKFYGSNYTALTELLPLSDYNMLMATSEICIYGSWRQEAMGNIVISLYLGAKVFLSERNPLFEILQKKGLVLFSLEEITQEDIDTPLSIEDKRRNRELLWKSFNWEQLKRITYSLFK